MARLARMLAGSAAAQGVLDLRWDSGWVAPPPPGMGAGAGDAQVSGSSLEKMLARAGPLLRTTPSHLPAPIGGQIERRRGPFRAWCTDRWPCTTSKTSNGLMEGGPIARCGRQPRFSVVASISPRLTRPVGRPIAPAAGFGRRLLYERGGPSTDWLDKGVTSSHRTLATSLHMLIRRGFALPYVEEWGPTRNRSPRIPNGRMSASCPCSADRGAAVEDGNTERGIRPARFPVLRFDRAGETDQPAENARTGKPERRGRDPSPIRLGGGIDAETRP